ncbi:MAG TPA: PPOX class F420-dependent oxidoreductase [Ktedonobacteraceae bacterium]|nr:PPOX class F420-dependent oxidoreductase [Ktedonobacteraceae bacterium]
MTLFTSEQIHFLMDQVRTAKLAIVRKDGRPHVTPVWFELDGDTIVFTTWHTTIKAESIRRDGRMCLCVDDEKPPFSYIHIEGTATLSADSQELKYWSTRIAGRYMGEQLSEAYGKRNSVEGELLVRVTPTNVIFIKDVTS